MAKIRRYPFLWTNRPNLFVAAHNFIAHIRKYLNPGLSAYTVRFFKLAIANKSINYLFNVIGTLS